MAWIVVFPRLFFFALRVRWSNISSVSCHRFYDRA